ncbi:nuclear RNA export factor 1-like [Schistocerca piceifrons]|uniref:nuclear RNA export factor 1-like n=1 Tax=Schistocerca piceifrons TaxID=274613 RepID=UPI001F5E689C|nr:nuclear RNA export factor 1-like [Schistocerca piceifrons]
MPKKNKPNRSWGSDGGIRDPGKYYFEHDDRVMDPPRRVSFKPPNRSKRRNKSWELLRSVMDDDVDMSGASTSGSRSYDRFNPYSGRGGRSHSSGSGRVRRSGRNSPSSNASGHRRKLVPNSCTWYKVVLPHGGKYSKEYILKTLANYVAPLVFSPLSYKISGNESYFYVDDYDAANELLNADRRITLTDGFKLNVIVRPAVPNIQLTDGVKDLLKQVMAKRFNPITKALDLSKLRDDPDMMEHALPIQRPAVLSAMLDLVAENISELAALNLSDNRLGGIDLLGVVARRLPSLTVLHIGNNKIRNIIELDALKGLRLVELVLEGNPVCRRYEDRSSYVSEVRKRFPKVLKLDGTELPPPILFDVQDEEAKIPLAKAHFACSEQGRTLVQAFLEQYYGVYDSESRLPLADAYHEEALFSLSAVYPPGQSTSHSRLNVYLGNNRNLMRVTETDRRRKLLRRGRHVVVTALADLPRTEHDPQSFTFDLLIFSPQLMVVAVSGMFREPGGSKPFPIRSFSRVMVIVPHGVGMCITNDELLITNPTADQLKVAFQPPKPVETPITSPAGPSQLVAATPPSAAIATAVSPIAMADEAVKQQIVEALAQQTGMNLLWSKKCLDDTNWDPQTALNAFTELSSKGLVPAEAFVK